MADSGNRAAVNPRLFHNGKVQLYAGDCIEVLRELPDNSIDAVVTDPPYHLTSIVKRFGGANAAPAKGNEAFIRASKGFMGKVWDGGDIAFRPELWAEVLRVLKPGGHMVCFGGTRTYHRMVCAIEDAGFEIRDQLAWVYGSGFPKSKNVALFIDKLQGYGNRGHCIATASRYDPDGTFEPNGEVLPAYEAKSEDSAPWQGWGTALKPAWEPICLARKPLSESTVAGNVLKWGTGALNIDGCRIETNDEIKPVFGGRKDEAHGSKYGHSDDYLSRVSPLGRWPANLCHDGSPEVLAGFPDAVGAVSNGRSGAPNLSYSSALGAQPQAPGYADSGSAARFFASFPQDETAKRFHYTSKADKDDRLNSRHPTVKPVDLMQWLVRLVCPKGATVLDPFAGTGTTGAAAFIEGRRAVLIEREAEYLADIERRMELLLSGPDERSWKLAKPESLEALPLFALTKPAA